MIVMRCGFGEEMMMDDHNDVDVHECSSCCLRSLRS